MCALDPLIALYGRPDALRLGNGPELTSQTLTDWASARGITLTYIQPGNPGQNAFIERFNRTYREEFLNAYPMRGSSITANIGPRTRWDTYRP